MANHYASKVFTTNQGSYDRLQFSSYTITSSDDKITGGVDGIWVLDDNKVGFTITIENYDQGSYAQWPKVNKPYVFIKCIADARFGGGIPIVTEDGAVLYTFAANYSVTPRYLAIVLDPAGGGGYHTWKLA